MVNKVAKLVKEEFFGEETGHDWYHIKRVWDLSEKIAKVEGANIEITALGALLHDIADHKFHEDSDKLAKKRVVEILADLSYDAATIEQVLHIVLNCSFKGGVGENKMKSLEGKIVQDADRIDALGAIGIARTFAYGGKVGNMIYDPEVKPMTYQNAEEYKNSKSHSVNHFYEKLLKLKDLMNTNEGQRLAKERHDYMRSFLEQFYKEWT